MWNASGEIDGIKVGFTNMFLGSDDFRRSQFILSRGIVHKLKAKGYSADQILDWLYRAAHKSETLNVIRVSEEIKEYHEQYSVAPKNRQGYVYFMYASDKQLMKIGCSADPDKRRKAVQKDIGCPVDVLAVIKTFMMYELEHEFHNLFERRHKHGEWFDLRPHHLRIVRRHLAKKIKPRAA